MTPATTLREIHQLAQWKVNAQINLASVLGPEDRNRPMTAIEVRCRERPLTDRKADIAYEEIIVRRSNRFGEHTIGL